MSKLRSAPFATFPTGNGPTPSSVLGLGPTLEFLGQSTAGDLYLNQDLASVGLVCGGLVGPAFPPFKLQPLSSWLMAETVHLLIHCFYHGIRLKMLRIPSSAWWLLT
jgi:hypothetical protein